MKVLVAIPVCGSFEIGRISLYQWDRTASPDCSFLLIDNSSHPTPYTALFERGFLDPKRWNYIKNDQNIGLVRSAQFAYELALPVETDILVLTHNDVWLYPEHADEIYKDDEWDRELSDTFHGNSDMGVVGLFGSKGCGREGHRLDTFGSLIEIAGHGRKMEQWIEPAVCLDGFFLACSMKMLREAVYDCPKCGGMGGGTLWVGNKGSDSEGTPWECETCKGSGKQRGGFDQRYKWHHVYDYDISLTSIELGYRNAVINIPCHHLSGLTANNDAFSTSGQDVHQANYERWKEKWSAKLGLSVDNGWVYTWGRG